MIVSYIYGAIRNSLFFLLYGGEWIAYKSDDKVTIYGLYRELARSGESENAMEIIDDYLNSSGKEDREKISRNAKKAYEIFHGKVYKNRNER